MTREIFLDQLREAQDTKVGRTGLAAMGYEKAVEVAAELLPELVALSEEDIDELKIICKGSREQPAYYKAPFTFGKSGYAAARVLDRHGITARMDGDRGTVSFEAKESE